VNIYIYCLWLPGFMSVDHVLSGLLQVLIRLPHIVAWFVRLPCCLEPSRLCSPGTEQLHFELLACPPMCSPIVCIKSALPFGAELQAVWPLKQGTLSFPSSSFSLSLSLSLSLFTYPKSCYSRQVCLHRLPRAFKLGLYLCTSSSSEVSCVLH